MSVLRHKKIVITAGPTREYFDPVRYLTNASSGEMGFSIAEELSKRGARVTVIHGPVQRKIPTKIHSIAVVSALEMDRQVMREVRGADVFVATAAVCDWRFKTVHRQKQKKHLQKMSLTLVPNPDILFKVGHQKRKPLLVGFALETKKVELAMRDKLKRKNLDLIIGNTPVTFAHSCIKPIWLEKSGRLTRGALITKKLLAKQLANWLEEKIYA